jgi:hypothetical protein
MEEVSTEEAEDDDEEEVIDEVEPLLPILWMEILIKEPCH